MGISQARTFFMQDELSSHGCSLHLFTRISKLIWPVCNSLAMPTCAAHPSFNMVRRGAASFPCIASTIRPGLPLIMGSVNGHVMRPLSLLRTGLFRALAWRHWPSQASICRHPMPRLFIVHAHTCASPATRPSAVRPHMLAVKWPFLSHLFLHTPRTQ